MAKLLVSQDDHVPSDRFLEYTLESISMEGEFTSNMVEFFREALPNFSAKLKASFASIEGLLKSNDHAVLGLKAGKKKIISDASGLDFLMFGDRYVMVPESFQGNLLAYGSLLDSNTKNLYHEQMVMLREYNLQLATFITNKDEKFSIKDHTALYTKARESREDVTAKLGKFFGNYGASGRVEVRKVMSRFAELDELIDTAENINNTNNPKTIHEMDAAVRECVERLDIIIERAKSTTNFNVSPEAMKNLAAGAYEIAKYVEFIGLFYFQCMTYTNCVKALCKQITDARN